MIVYTKIDDCDPTTWSHPEWALATKGLARIGTFVVEHASGFGTEVPQHVAKENCQNWKPSVSPCLAVKKMSRVKTLASRTLPGTTRPDI
jgi:hypothetical protein